MPNLDFLDLDWLDIDFPDFDIDFHSALDMPFLSLSTLDFRSAFAYIPGIEDLNLPDFSVSDFNLDWEPPTFQVPEHACQPMGKK